MTNNKRLFPLPSQDATRMMALAVAALILLVNLAIMTGFFLQAPLFGTLVDSPAPLLIGTFELLLIAPFVYRLSTDSAPEAMVLEGPPVLR